MSENESQPKRSSNFHLYLIGGIVLLGIVLTTLARMRDNWPGSKVLGIDERPLVLYLAPADADRANIWAAIPIEGGGISPGTNQQITNSLNGVFDFAVNPDGERIAYTVPEEGTRAADIWLVDITDGTDRIVVDCDEESCTSPAWHPSGDLLAYERTQFSTSGPDAPIDRRTSVWVADLRQNPPEQRPLFDDDTILTRAPLWSPDGLQIAVFKPDEQTVIVHNFESGTSQRIESSYGAVGSFRPDGSALVYPVIIPDDSGIPGVALRWFDLASGDVRDLTNPATRTDDAIAVWSPNGEDIAIARRNLAVDLTGPRYVLTLNPDTGATEDLITDPAYDNSALRWDASGDRLLMQRFGRPTTAETQPEVWVYDMQQDTLAHVATNAYHARWLP